VIPGTLNLALTVAAASACCGALWLASHGSPWQIALAAIAFSFVNNTMFSLLHESVHGIAHANRRVNEGLGTFAATFFPTSLSLQRVFHLAHHARNRTVDEQFDYIRSFDRAWLKRAQWYAILTGLYWVFVPLGGLAYLLWPGVLSTLCHPEPAKRGEGPPASSAAVANRTGSFAVYAAQDDKGPRGLRNVIATQTGASSMFAHLDDAPRARIRIELLLAIAVQVAMFVALDLTALGWLFCYAAFAINWSSLQYTDHAFSKLDVRDGAWNLRVNPITRALFLNYHHHLAHHRHPHVPWIHLGEYIDPSEERPSFWRIYGQMWRGPRLLP